MGRLVYVLLSCAQSLKISGARGLAEALSHSHSPRSGTRLALLVNFLYKDISILSIAICDQVYSSREASSAQLPEPRLKRYGQRLDRGNHLSRGEQRWTLYI